MMLPLGFRLFIREVFHMAELSKLPNIGKIVESQLNQVGITTAVELKEIGAKAAWLKIQEIENLGKHF